MVVMEVMVELGLQIRFQVLLSHTLVVEAVVSPQEQEHRAQGVLVAGGRVRGGGCGRLTLAVAQPSRLPRPRPGRTVPVKIIT